MNILFKLVTANNYCDWNGEYCMQNLGLNKILVTEILIIIYKSARVNILL